MRPAWLEIDLGALAHNIARVRQHVGPKVELIAVVKANAYGHGAEAVARCALACGARLLAVALVGEGIALRQAGLDAPILVLGAADPDEAPLFVEHDILATVTTAELARALSRAAVAQGKTARCHVKVDSGMGRLGVRVEEVGRFGELLRELPGLRVEGAFSHFACSQDDPDFTHLQTRRFLAALPQLEQALGHPVGMRHLANSGGVVGYPESWLDAVRPGAVVYGIFTIHNAEHLPGTRQVMSLKARIVALRQVRPGESVGYDRTYVASGPTLTAVLPLGYADGYPRALSSVGEVLVRGFRCPVLGRVSMDTTIIGVGHVPGVAVGDEAVLLGAQGNDLITTGEVARWGGTIVQEIAARMSTRLPRVYLGEPGTQSPGAHHECTDDRHGSGTGHYGQSGAGV